MNRNDASIFVSALVFGMALIALAVITTIQKHPPPNIPPEKIATVVEGHRLFKYGQQQ